MCLTKKKNKKKKNVPVMYGLAAVSSDPNPLPMMKMHTQNPAKLLCMIAGMARSAPIPYRLKPQMKTAR